MVRQTGLSNAGPRPPQQKTHPGAQAPSGIRAPSAAQPQPSGGTEPEETAEQRRELKTACDALSAAEREGGYAAARRACEARLESIPHTLAWRLHLELAECAKRSADLVQVKYHLEQSLVPPPKIAQVWLEACRTFEELGELEECRSLVERGLESCPASEPLTLKLVRILERLDDLDTLRSVVGSLRHEPLEKVCKVFIEAAHIEVRAGNVDGARALLNGIMVRMPHHGPIFCEACHLEALLGDWQAALSIAEAGVQTCCKHGPLWFSLVQLAEKANGPQSAQEYASQALRNASQELHWKFHFEVAAAYSRDGDLQRSRHFIGLAALNCPKHLRWKIWLLASRTELWYGSADASRQLLAKAASDVPCKMKASVCIERARTEEFLGDLQMARAALAEAQAFEGHDWKVFLESIFMETRAGSLATAKQAALAALEVQPAFGRLWSALATVEHSTVEGIETAMFTCRKASQEVPKSGEVWCEFARVYMNPIGASFDLDRAHKCLEFAIRLTPQYGDSFLELLRLRFLLEIRHQLRADAVAAGWLTATTSSGNESQLQVLALVLQRLQKQLVDGMRSGSFSFKAEGKPSIQEDKEGQLVPLEQLDMLCAYADPNYGFLWFWNRQSNLSSPREVMQKMHQEIISDLVDGGALNTYLWALACGVFGLDISNRAISPLNENADRQFTTRDFVVGSVRLSHCFAHGSANLESLERWRLIFGSDILCA